MVLKDANRESNAAQPVTPMSEIQRHQGMLLDEFARAYPDWEWSERRRRNRLMYDDQGRAWVPMFDPEYGVPYAYDEPGFTPEAEESLLAIARKAREDVQAGRFTWFDELDADEEFWNNE